MSAGRACTATFVASAPAALDLTGTWLVDYTCTGSGGNFSGRDILTVIQTGMRVVFDSHPDGGTFTGTLVGNTMTYAGAGVGYSENGVWTMQGANDFTKTSDYTNTATRLGGSCPGTGRRQ